MNSKPIDPATPKSKGKFKKGVIRVVKLVPYGKVVSYGQVALYLGLPRAARQIGWVLNKLSSNELPWWRVVNNSGRISIKGSRYSSDYQRKLLVKEGLTVADDLTFDIEKYRFIPDEKFLAKFELDPAYLEFITSKLPFSRYFPKSQ